ncbi:MAG: hypothetical protein AB8B62_12175 [Roseobacter sp.]
MNNAGAIDDEGFVLMGYDVDPGGTSPFATSVPGIFAVGDSCYGSENMLRLVWAKAPFISVTRLVT